MTVLFELYTTNTFVINNMLRICRVFSNELPLQFSKSGLICRITDGSQILLHCRIHRKLFQVYESPVADFPCSIIVPDCRLFKRVVVNALNCDGRLRILLDNEGTMTVNGVRIKCDLGTSYITNESTGYTSSNDAPFFRIFKEDFIQILSDVRAIGSNYLDLVAKPGVLKLESRSSKAEYSQTINGYFNCREPSQSRLYHTDFLRRVLSANRAGSMININNMGSFLEIDLNDVSSYAEIVLVMACKVSVLAVAK